MEEQLMKKVFVFCSILSVTALVIMMLFMYVNNHDGLLRSMVTEEVKAEETETGETTKSYLGIPIPNGISGKDITIEDHYMERTLVVTIPHASVEFYDGKVLDGSAQHIEAVYYDADAQAVKIHIILEELCDYHTDFFQNEIQISFVPIQEVYDKILVVDAGFGGTSTGTVSYGISEKEVALGITQKLKQMLDQTDIKVYYTRLSDVDVTEEDRIGIADLSGADLYLSIHANGDATTHVSTGAMTHYHQSGAGAQLTNQALAELVQKSVLDSTEAYDAGVVEDAGNIELLNHLKIPAVMFEAGYLTNRKEALLLASAPYQEKIAEGLYEGILEAYQKLGKTVNQVDVDE